MTTLAILLALSSRVGAIDLPRHSSPPDGSLFPESLLYCGEC